MKTLKIQIPTGYEIDEQNSTFQEIKFKEISKNVRDRIQTIDDIFSLNGTTEEDFNKKWNKDLFTTAEIGLGLEILLVNAYNEGRKSDWNDDTWKRYPYFYMQEETFRLFGVDGLSESSYAPSALCFNGSEADENCRDAVSKFPHIYKQSRLG